jgi:hypothetical protein
MLIVENPAMMYSVRPWYFMWGGRQILKCNWNRISTYSLLRSEEN